MNQPSDLNPELREKLVAYLDGELDETGAQEIERTLAQSPDVRREVDDLTRTWDMLDALPRARTTEEFTERTLSTIHVTEEDIQPSEGRWRRHVRRAGLMAAWAAGLSTAACLSFLLTNRWIPTESDVLLEELPIVRELDVYTEVDNLEFLKELQASGMFDAEPDEESR